MTKVLKGGSLRGVLSLAQAQGYTHAAFIIRHERLWVVGGLS